MHKTVIGEKLDMGKIVFPLVRNHVKRCLLVTNTKVGKLYAKSVGDCLKKRGIETRTVILPDGERYKNLKTLEKLYSAAVKNLITRKCFAVALGGGVVGDITGFFAATFMRGIDFIQIPTSLLAMVDASIGGKTGVDLKEGKNLAGAFKMPLAVIIDTAFLGTLPAEEMRNGFGEIVKYALLDEKFYGFLSPRADEIRSPGSKFLTDVIKKSVKIKEDIVRRDYLEGGPRRVLNLGHTFGHAIETALAYRNISHGEAVASGMIDAVDLSFYLRLCGKDEREKALSLITRAGFQKIKIDNGKLLKLIMADKKVIDRNPVFVLIKGAGKPLVKEVPVKVLQKWLKH
ncbi:MAG: 3-dehydroquinate synthase, partial [Elusimicrobiota bacterium]|nr:3-dehydroquinate synthase [Elusimicrobiota bacterium]